MDEPVPIRRAAVGCLLIAVAGLAFALVVRPAIFSLAPARDDASVVVATAAEVADGPVERDVLLARSYGWDGERDAGEGRVQVRLIVAPGPFAGVTAVSAASPVVADCPLEIAQVGLTDCAGRAWTLDGTPLEADLPPLDRFPAKVNAGSVIVDMTRTIDG